MGPETTPEPSKPTIHSEGATVTFCRPVAYHIPLTAETEIQTAEHHHGSRRRDQERFCIWYY